MKKIILLPLLALLLAGCNNKGSSELPSSDNSQNTSQTSSEPTSTSTTSASESSESLISNEGTSANTSTETSTTSEGTSSNTSSEGSSSETKVEDANLSEISALALTYKANLPTSGAKVYISDVVVKFTAQLLTYQNYIAGGGWGTSYRVFAANETGTMMLGLSTNDIKKYHHLQQVYTFEGKLGLYGDEPTVIVTSYEYLANVTLNYDLDALAVERDNLDDLLTRVKSFTRNSKGLAYDTKISKYTLRYVMKMDATLGLFTDGKQLIQVNGHDKINNGLTKGNTYTVYVREGMYQFKPTLEHIKFVASSEEIALSVDEAVTVTANHMWNYKYDLDAKIDTSNLAYTDLFTNVYYIEGYANVYFKGAYENIILEDISRDPYENIAAAGAGKVLFLSNDQYFQIENEADKRAAQPLYNYTFFDEGEDTKQKIGVYFTLHRWNPDEGGKWQVQVLPEPIVEIN